MLAINLQHDTSRTIIPIELFLCRDIFLYDIALGKEGSAGWWCAYCKLMKLDWQINGYNRGDSWTIDDIALHAEGIE